MADPDTDRFMLVPTTGPDSVPRDVAQARTRVFVDRRSMKPVKVVFEWKVGDVMWGYAAPVDEVIVRG